MIGGVAVLTENGKTGNMLAPMSNIFVFDTKTNQWDMKKAISDTSTRMPSTRTSHNAVVSKYVYNCAICHVNDFCLL